jgi:hypothetical protein
MGHFTASTVPGCRTPHFWLEDGRSLYDAFGAAYTLLQLRSSCGPSVAALQSAAARHHVPMEVLDLSAHPGVPGEYRHALLIARSDAHTVWRGDTADVKMAEQVMARLSGRA